MTSLLKSKRQHLAFKADERPCYVQRTPAEVVELRLPEPPSTNRLFRRSGPKVVKTEAYRAWRRQAEAVGNLQRLGRRVGPSDVSIYIPETRKDTDNLAKPLIDAARHIGVIADDGPSYVRNVSLIRTSEHEDCRLVFRPTDLIPQPF
ncbi:RusA family crossover junction endodeoxyribonuclease [Methylobacterium oryzisoli]|uniref:RusA family crossover junction endodeoxyribonuclease n=1 Tax=Methylobacterium oryzisoli TaxID=3385502 RepID=UPI0038916604